MGAVQNHVISSPRYTAAPYIIRTLGTQYAMFRGSDKISRMPHLWTQNLSQLLAAYGYLAVFVLVAVESAGIPVPGETMLLTAAVYAGTTHKLQIWLVIAAAIAGAILGDNAGFWIGREGGMRLLRRYGPYVRLDERKLKVGRYLFKRYGTWVVFFGRFIALLRALAAFLAGANGMPWDRFLIANAAGGVLWATAYGLAAYFLGDQVNALVGSARWGLLAGAALVLLGSIFFLRRNAARLADEAERALPGPV